MDQLSSLSGKQQELLHIDFRSLMTRSIALPAASRFFLATPEIFHSLSDSPYNQRRRSCEIAMERLAEKLHDKQSSRNYTHLRDISAQEFDRLKSILAPEPRKRAAHIIGENQRVTEAEAALRSGEIGTFGRLMFDSHRSSRDLFENSAHELDSIVSFAAEAGALGARLSGGGWGGSLIVLSTEEHVAQVTGSIERQCGEAGLKVDFMPVVPSDGAWVRTT
jgi:galactokinase